MIRVATDPRPDWRRKVSELGLLYHSHQGLPYWDESSYYLFSAPEIDDLQVATDQLNEICLQACQNVIDNHRFADLGIGEAATTLIKRTWDEEPPSLYGRMDLAYTGEGRPPKLLEYNADTPTSLLEAAVVQWHWLEETSPRGDQFNSIHERLLGKWQELRDGGYLPGQLVHFACLPNPEDVLTTNYLRDLADQAGMATEFLHMADIGYDDARGVFVDLQGRPMQCVFKLYPWEWMTNDAFAQHLTATAERTLWIEPAWKMLLSNKAILAILWELFPDHPNLLPAYLDGPRDLDSWVRKPLLGREGGNISIHHRGRLLQESVGTYGEGRWVYQAWRELPSFEGRRPVVGSWVIDQQSAGIGIRESGDMITGSHSPFVPHRFI